jgi:hypothetical protein
MANLGLPFFIAQHGEKMRRIAFVYSLENSEYFTCRSESRRKLDKFDDTPAVLLHYGC